MWLNNDNTLYIKCFINSTKILTTYKLICKNFFYAACNYIKYILLRQNLLAWVSFILIHWLIDWCLTPTLAVFQIYPGVNKLLEQSITYSYCLHCPYIPLSRQIKHLHIYIEFTIWLTLYFVFIQSLHQKHLT